MSANRIVLSLFRSLLKLSKHAERTVAPHCGPDYLRVDFLRVAAVPLGCKYLEPLAARPIAPTELVRQSFRLPDLSDVSQDDRIDSAFSCLRQHKVLLEWYHSAVEERAQKEQEVHRKLILSQGMRWRVSNPEQQADAWYRGIIASQGVRWGVNESAHCSLHLSERSQFRAREWNPMM